MDTNRASVTTSCLGPGRKTIISSDPNIDDLIIGRSERRAFYIRVIDTQLMYSVADMTNQIVKEDRHVQIFTGVTIGDYFKDFWLPRMVNVAVSFVVEKIWNDSVGIPSSSFGEEIGDDICTRVLDSMTSDSINKNSGVMFNIDSKSGQALTIFWIRFLCRQAFKRKL